MFLYDNVGFLHRFIAFFLMANTLLGILWQPLVYADFKLRQEYIAEVLCIKKEAPIPVCYGSCVLTDRLKQVDLPQESNRPPTPQNRLLEINFFKNNHEINMPTPISVSDVGFQAIAGNNTLSKGFALDVFNPPQLV